MEDCEALIALLQLQSSQVEHFAKVSDAQTRLTAAELQRLRAHLAEISHWLHEGNDDALRQLIEPSKTAEANDVHNMDSTSFLTTAEIERAAGSLPFQDGIAAPPPSVAVGLAPSENAGATAAVDPSKIQAALQALGQHAAATTLPMKIDDYARLVAYTEAGGPSATGEQRQTLHAQHGISDETQRAAIDTTFTSYFQKNAAAHETYGQTVEQWRVYLRGGRR